MRQYSFVISPEAIDQFKKCIAVYERQRVIRRFIVEEYEFLGSFESLDDVPVSHIVFPFHLPDEAIARIDEVVQKAHEFGFSHVNRSSVMRDVIQVINQRNTPGTDKKESKRQTFQVERETIESLSHVIPHYERNATIERFILEAYHPSTHPDVLQHKPAEKKSVLIEMDKRAFDRLDRYIKDLPLKGISRAALFRDVLRQLSDQFQKNNPRQKALEQQLKQVLSEYKTVANESVVRETIKQYLKD